VDLRRLRIGEWLAAAGGAALLAAMFLDWYAVVVDVGSLGELSAEFNAWQSLDVIDILLALVAALAIGLAVLQATQSSPALPVGAGVLTTTLGAVAVLLVLYRIIDQPGDGEFVEVRVGAWAGLAATVVITAGGWASLREEGVRGDSPGPEPELRPPPP
jgi:hypothetical protein